MRFYKKGISPLIATLLLISVAVSIGTTIMSFGSAFYEERRLLTEVELPCRYMNLELNLVNGVSQVCFNRDSQSIEFTITNRANLNVESLIVWAVGDEISVTDVTNGIAPGYPLKQKISYDSNVYGNLKQMQFIPRIKQEENVVACSNKKLVIEEIRTC